MIPKIRIKFDQFVWGDVLEQRGIAGHVLAIILRYSYGLIRDMFSGQITLRAMSLVYTTLLSVVPLIAFSFSVLKAFGVHNQLEPLLYELLKPLGTQGAEITTQVIQLVDNVKGGVLGGISLAFFIYTAITMVQKVEESFNYVWYVAKPRSLARKLTDIVDVIIEHQTEFADAFNSDREARESLEIHSFRGVIRFSYLRRARAKQFVGELRFFQ